MSGGNSRHLVTTNSPSFSTKQSIACRPSPHSDHRNDSEGRKSFRNQPFGIFKSLLPKAQATALSAGPLCPASDRNTPNPNKGISTPLFSLMVLEKLVATVTMLLFTSVSTLLKAKIQNIKNVSKMVICLSKEILS